MVKNNQSEEFKKPLNQEHRELENRRELVEAIEEEQRRQIALEIQRNEQRNERLRQAAENLTRQRMRLEFAYEVLRRTFGKF